MHVQSVLQACWGVLLALSPWLLIGMAVAGMIHVLLPPGLVRRQLAGPLGVVKAVLLGVPLPLCSCGVIPAGLGLRRDGADRGAAVGFLISTPQTGVDSILVTSAFLGLPFAIFKLVSAAVMGLAGGWLTQIATAKDRSAETTFEASVAPGRSARDGLAHALDILRSIWAWVVVGIVLSATLEVFVPANGLAGLSGSGPLVPLLTALVISLPMYVCATASVPIAAALVASGLPPGAALVFLIAGPATNLATIGAIARGLGRRTAAIYLGTIVAGSMLSALAFDFLLEGGEITVPHLHGESSLVAIASSIVLLALLAWFAIADLLGWLRRYRNRPGQGPSVELALSGLRCGNCVQRLEAALREQPGVVSVLVTLDPARAVVQGEIDESRVRETVRRTGFSVV